MIAMQLEGVDTAWAVNRLMQFVTDTRTTETDHGFYVACGRDSAVAWLGVIHPILDRLYPTWRTEHADMSYGEFHNERDAAQMLIGRIESHAEVAKRLGGADASPQIAASGLHPLIWKAASAQWSTGHRHEAVLAAAKAVNSLLQQKVSRRDLSEADLVKQAFSKDAPEQGKSRLRFPGAGNTQMAESMRRGVMEFGGGCFAAIRNPVGHIPNDELELDDQLALERLAALSLLARWVDDAVVDSALSPVPPKAGQSGGS